jgi:hypothetical protein
MNQKPTALFRLDEQIFFTMAALAVLSVIVLAFRFTTRTTCKPFSINVSTSKLVEDQAIYFKVAAAHNAKAYHWDFGDGVKKREIVSETNHTYASPGQYTVTLTLSGNCSETKTIHIQAASIPVVSKARIGGPDTAYVDEPVEFRDESTGAKSWDWAFEDPERIDSKTKNPSYTYSTIGPKTVSLRINGRQDLTDGKTVIIIKRPVLPPANTNVVRPRPRPRPAPIDIESNPTEDPLPNPSDTGVRRPELAPEAIAPPISTEDLAEMFKQVMHGTKKDTDFAIYFCNNDAAVTVTWGDRTMPVKEFCVRLNSLERRNRIRISVTRITKNDSHCIKSITAVIKRRNLIGRYETITP